MGVCGGVYLCAYKKKGLVLFLNPLIIEVIAQVLTADAQPGCKQPVAH